MMQLKTLFLADIGEIEKDFEHVDFEEGEK